MPPNATSAVGGVIVTLGGGLTADLNPPHELFMAEANRPGALHLTPDEGPVEAGTTIAHWNSTHVEQDGNAVHFRCLARDGSCLCTARVDFEDRRGFFFRRALDSSFGPEGQFGPPLDRLIFACLLAERGRAIAHAAGLVLDGGGVFLGATSGGGKTTLSNLAQRAGITVLSDERVVVGLDDGDKPTLWGTPWPGEGGQALPGPAPLTRLLFLEKGNHNTLEPLRPAAALAQLLSLCTLPYWNREATRRAVDGVAQTLAGLPAAVLRFVPDGSSVDYVRDLLTS